MDDRQHKIRVLLIDNDERLVKALASAVMERGPQVIAETAVTPESALLLLSVTEYDIILGDLCMPDMDGLSLLKQCKVMRPETPFVFLTGHGDPNIEQEVRKAGAYALLHKPIDAAVLLAVVGRAILASPLQTRTTDASVTLTHNPTVGEPGCHWHLQVLKKLNVRNELLRSKIQTLAELHQRDSSSP